MHKSESVHVRQATVADIDLLAPLFDAYRAFYGQASDIDLARAFLLERFQHNQSVLFIAVKTSGAAVGFTQLYPSFSSVRAARIFILNDLFVVPDCATVWRRGQAAGGYGSLWPGSRGRSSDFVHCC